MFVINIGRNRGFTWERCPHRPDVENETAQIVAGVDRSAVNAGRVVVHNAQYVTDLIRADDASDGALCEALWGRPLPRRLPHPHMWVETSPGVAVSVREVDTPGQDTAWMCAMYLANWQGGKLDTASPADLATVTTIDFTGGVAGEGSWKSLVTAPRRWGRAYDPEQHESHDVLAMLVALLHCKNVVTDTWHPDDKTIRRHRKAGNLPPVSYKTLKLTLPATVRPKGESGEPNPDDKKRFHLCRGHFKNLTHPRFKNPGLHWWPSHWRGDPQLGVVHKDYQIQPAE
jgi:hypothetical protein